MENRKVDYCEILTEDQLGEKRFSRTALRKHYCETWEKRLLKILEAVLRNMGHEISEIMQIYKKKPPLRNLGQKRLLRNL